MAQTFALSVTLQAETGHRLVEHVPQLVLQAKALGLTLVALVFVLRRINLGCALTKGEQREVLAQAVNLVITARLLED